MDKPPTNATSTPAPQAGTVDIEAFARNVARLVEESGKALAAYMKPREEGKIKGEFAENVTDVVKTLGTVAPYPGVHDLPAPRREPTMNDAAKLKLENDLNELRTRQKKFIDTGTKSRGDAAAARASAARDKARAAAQNKPPAADSR